MKQPASANRSSHEVRSDRDGVCAEKNRVATLAKSEQSDSLEKAVLRGKRVAVVVYSHFPSDPRPRRAAESLSSEGMKVEVICLKNRKDEPARETLNGISVLRLPLTHQRGGKLQYLLQYGTFLLACFGILAWRCLYRRYSLVHVHNMPDILVFAGLVPKILGAKVILDLHDPMPELMMTIFGLRSESFAVRLLRNLERWSIRFADIVLTPNIAFQKLFTSRNGRADKVRVIMNSPDETIFHYRPVESQPSAGVESGKPFVIMYHGALVERHGLDIAVEALKILRKSVPNAELRIYGRPTPFVHRVMDNARAIGLEQAVHYMGPRNLEQIAEAIDSCDVGVIPNRRSVFTEINLPTRIFENLSRGKPVIAPSTSGIRDYFGEGELLFFEPDDADDLARKMQYVFTQREEVRDIVSRGQMVYLAHRWQEERAKLQRTVAQLLDSGSTAKVTYQCRTQAELVGRSNE